MRIRHEKKLISLSFLLLLTLSITLLISNHVSNGDRRISHMQNNPFYDIFYDYYQDKTPTAKKQLEELFTSTQYGKEALINYGVIQHIEKNKSEAEEYYKKSLEKGDRRALIYLFSLYLNSYNERYLKLLNSIKNKSNSRWIEYEKGVYYLKTGQSEMGIKHLKRAVDLGFTSTTLLDEEPVFDSIRQSKDFAALRKETIRNRTHHVPLTDKLKKDENAYYMNHPYGVSPAIRSAVYFEMLRKYDKSEGILLSRIKSTTLPFRDRSIALLLLARIKTKRGEISSAKKYLKKFLDHLHSKDTDRTGYKIIMRQFHKDIIKNDPFLRRLY